MIDADPIVEIPVHQFLHGTDLEGFQKAGVIVAHEIADSPL
jgi:hypothetical protein